MPRERPGVGSGTRHRLVRPAALAERTARGGLVIVAVALPLALGAFAAVVLTAPSLDAGARAATAAITGPLAPGGGVAWLLHVGVLGVLAGAWLVGLGLVVSELG